MLFKWDFSCSARFKRVYQEAVFREYSRIPINYSGLSLYRHVYTTPVIKPGRHKVCDHAIFPSIVITVSITGIFFPDFSRALFTT
jgi:hypothetical protein